MTERGALGIPYESQSGGPSNRMCGAAALSMVYRSLADVRAGRARAERGERRRGEDRRNRTQGPPGGLERRQGPRRIVDVTQADIWKQISKPNRFGAISGATHLMVKDALARGLSAVALQAASPLQLLLACRNNGVRAILNHRLRQDGAAGHFTVLVGMDESGVTVHDPSAGPSRRIPHDVLLDLWQPRSADSEIIGNVLIGVADHPPRLSRCIACATPIPAEEPCPKCRVAIPLAPSALLGCTDPACMKRSWLRVCCPWCDYTFPVVGGAGEEPRGAGKDPLDLGPLFAQLDTFRNQVLGVPRLAGNEDILQQFAVIDAARERLQLAIPEERVRIANEDLALQARLDAAAKEGAKVREARDAASASAAPLDGDALAAKLLKDLGIVK
jgi:hypothetical protein